MLGYGCPWKGHCRHKASGYEKKIYCDNDKGGWERCPHRPINEGNKKVMQEDGWRKGQHAKETQGGALLGFVVLACIVASVLKACGAY